MSFLGGALEKLDPAERVRRHLTRDLELRRKDERSATDFSGYVYLGSADLILRHGQFWSGRRLPEQYEAHRGVPNECYWNALDAAQANPELTYCEGVYTVGFGTPQSHAWCIDPNGELVELTFPTNVDQLGARSHETKMPFLPPEHWGYYGATFDTAYVTAYAAEFGMPMFDRSRAELWESEATYGHQAAVSTKSREAFHAREFVTHDFPVLKYKYDPNRTELP